uniref:RING finger and CHY zinc finger domain-containing protein 1 n=1 Tax=Globisporangium ultimum (strain ATCC 200006 / CBS 805.95 / DAOM BR144) TaxID=431595 RepID=K3WU11_GLOUD
MSDRPEHVHDEVEETNQQQEPQRHTHDHAHHHSHSHHGHAHHGHTHAATPTALPPPINNNHDQQAILKAQIRQIQSSTSLTPKEKAESVQNLMMKQWNDSRDKVVLTKRQESDTEADQKRTTYFNEAENILGCSHYQRSCKLQAKCCGKWYPCRFCHDENESHAIDRYATENILCMKCETVQPMSNECINEKCKTVFGRYFCATCKFFDDDPTKDIYHCDKCRICRIGKGLDIDYFHCDRCNACMSISLKKHKCVERSLESDCPICHSYMFTSTTPVMFLPCGHCMHVSCYEEYTLTNYICPLCSKSLGDMELYFASIDELLEREQMPPEYQDYKSFIYCSDCERKSTTNFHFVYHKCQFEDCMSYNTKLLRQFRELGTHVASAESEILVNFTQ